MSLPHPIPTETSFFRDPDLFDALKNHVLPQLLRRRRLQKKLTIWCAACSNGQEAYSLAMLLQEYFPSLTSSWQLDFLATDISSAVIARARNGEYSDAEIQRRLPPSLKSRYFSQHGLRWKIAQELRLLVEFNELDLRDNWSNIPQPIDLILMRNVLIYYDLVTRELILDRVLNALQPDGYLFLGATETAFNLDGTFQAVPLGQAIGYQVRSQS
jgi:chemotaxis protein methyltransferase CheR